MLHAPRGGLRATTRAQRRGLSPASRMATLPHFVIAPTTCGKTQSTDSILGWGHGRPHATLPLSLDPTYEAEGIATGPTSELTVEKAIQMTAAMRSCCTTSKHTTPNGSTKRRRLALDGCKCVASPDARSSALMPCLDTTQLAGTRHKWLHQPPSAGDIRRANNPLLTATGQRRSTHEEVPLLHRTLSRQSFLLHNSVRDCHETGKAGHKQIPQALQGGDAHNDCSLGRISMGALAAPPP